MCDADKRIVIHLSEICSSNGELAQVRSADAARVLVAEGTMVEYGYYPEVHGDILKGSAVRVKSIASASCTTLVKMRLSHVGPHSIDWMKDDAICLALNNVGGFCRERRVICLHICGEHISMY